MFYWNDNVDYNECWDAIPATAVLKGSPEVKQNVFGFWAKDRESVGEEVTFIYKCRQVNADKLQGTGEAIISGDRVYAVVNQAHFITPNIPAGVAGVDYYYCGIAKFDAAADDARVIIEFDGTWLEREAV